MDPPLLNRRQLIGEAGRRPTDENFRYRDAWNYLCDSYPLASSAFCPFCFVPSMGRRRGGRREAGGTMAKCDGRVTDVEERGKYRVMKFADTYDTRKDIKQSEGR